MGILVTKVSYILTQMQSFLRRIKKNATSKFYWKKCTNATPFLSSCQVEAKWIS